MTKSIQLFVYLNFFINTTQILMGITEQLGYFISLFLSCLPSFLLKAEWLQYAVHGATLEESPEIGTDPGNVGDVETVVLVTDC